MDASHSICALSQKKSTTSILEAQSFASIRKSLTRETGKKNVKISYLMLVNLGNITRNFFIRMIGLKHFYCVRLNLRSKDALALKFVGFKRIFKTLTYATYTCEKVNKSYNTHYINSSIYVLIQFHYWSNLILEEINNSRTSTSRMPAIW